MTEFVGVLILALQTACWLRLKESWTRMKTLSNKPKGLLQENLVSTKRTLQSLGTKLQSLETF